MKKLLCVLLSLVLLLSFAACGQKRAETTVSNDKEQIEVLLRNRAKSIFCLATEEEYRSLYPDCYWNSYEEKGIPFAELYESLVAAVDGQTPEDRLLGAVGENYSFAVEITSLDVLDDENTLSQKEANIKKMFDLEVTLEAYANASYTQRVVGDRSSYEQKVSAQYLYKIGGIWYIGF